VHSSWNEECENKTKQTNKQTNKKPLRILAALRPEKKAAKLGNGQLDSHVYRETHVRIWNRLAMSLSKEQSGESPLEIFWECNQQSREKTVSKFAC